MRGALLAAVLDKIHRAVNPAGRCWVGRSAQEGPSPRPCFVARRLGSDPRGPPLPALAVGCGSGDNLARDCCVSSFARQAPPGAASSCSEGAYISDGLRARLAGRDHGRVLSATRGRTEGPSAREHRTSSCSPTVTSRQRLARRRLPGRARSGRLWRWVKPAVPCALVRLHRRQPAQTRCRGRTGRRIRELFPDAGSSGARYARRRRSRDVSRWHPALYTFLSTPFPVA
jgi:hypothetical protein